MGAGSAFTAGMNRAPRRQMDYIDISKLSMPSGRITMSGPSEGQRDMEKAAALERQKAEQARIDAQKREEMNIKWADVASKRKEADAGVDLSKAETNQLNQKTEMTEDQHRRMNGFQAAMIGLQQRNAQMIQDGWAKMLPQGSGDVKTAKGKDGTKTLSLEVPQFSFNGDGTGTVTMSDGTTAQFQNPQEVYKMILAPLNPMSEVDKAKADKYKAEAEKARGKSGGGGKINEYDKMDYQAMIKERAELQEVLTSGKDAAGYPIDPEKMSAMQARVDEIGQGLDKIAGRERAPMEVPGGSGPGPDGLASAHGGEYDLANGQGRALDVDTAKAFLAKTGGDKALAREMAKKAGFVIPGNDDKKKKKKKKDGGGDGGGGGGSTGGGGGSN